ncbi:hypothetical protein BFX25_15200 [Vibrio cholerae]|nr:hypothetical protein BFX25_15200 [Vibrio cholerae]
MRQCRPLLNHVNQRSTSPLENQEALAYLNTVSVWYFAVFNGKAFCTGFVALPPSRGGDGRGYFAPEELNVENKYFRETQILLAPPPSMGRLGGGISRQMS